MTNLELLQAAKTALLTSLAANAGKPDYSINWQSITYGELMDRLSKINAAMAVEQGPVEAISEGY